MKKASTKDKDDKVTELQLLEIFSHLITEDCDINHIHHHHSQKDKNKLNQINTFIFLHESYL